MKRYPSKVDIYTRSDSNNNIYTYNINNYGLNNEQKPEKKIIKIVCIQNYYSNYFYNS